MPFAVVAMDAATAAQEGTYCWGMRKGACADDPAWIQVFAWIDDDLEYQSPGHHMGNPEESRNPGALTVGATHWWDTQTIARYSSRGPTLDGRTKPDLTGVACGRSTIVAPETVTSSGGAIMCWFAGTSASAPHVAGLAALVKQRFANYAPEFVARYLKRNAAERGSVGADNTWGYGLATLPDPNAVPPPIRAAPAANITAVNGRNTGEAVIAWDAAPGATHYRIGCVNMERDYPRAKASSTGNWREAFLYFGVDARNVDPVRPRYVFPGLQEGAYHACTVLTNNSRHGQPTWPARPTGSTSPSRTAAGRVRFALERIDRQRLVSLCGELPECTNRNPQCGRSGAAGLAVPMGLGTAGDDQD